MADLEGTPCRLVYDEAPKIIDGPEFATVATLLENQADLVDSGRTDPR
jgi:hypothetical protein